MNAYMQEMKQFGIFIFLLSLATSFPCLGQDVFRDQDVAGADCPDCPWMVPIKPGRFYMGTTPDVGHDDERAKDGMALAVSIPYGFSVSKGEITRGQFAAFLKETQYPLANSCAGHFAGAFSKKTGVTWQNPGFVQQDQHPVVCVRWHDAKAYTQWLSLKTGLTYRLLTEAEWEYSARAGASSRYWWGDGVPEHITNCLRGCVDDYPNTAPVYSMPPNPFGLHHMNGNVWEWVEDCYDADAYKKFNAIYPASIKGKPDCNRVIRGGSWVENPWSLRSSNREGWQPNTPLNDLGFRVVRVEADKPS